MPAHRWPCRLSRRVAGPAPDRILPHVKLPAEIFRTYDIRGVVGNSLTPAGVRVITRPPGSPRRESAAAAFAPSRARLHSAHELVASASRVIAAGGAALID